MKDLFLIRGLPGAGKSTLAEKLGGFAIAADDYFTDDNGDYNFVPERLADAHHWCQQRVTYWMHNWPRGTFGIIVHNTFTTKAELQPYLDLAVKFGFTVTVINLFDAGLTDEQLAEQTIHGVPVETIAKMRARFEH